MIGRRPSVAVLLGITAALSMAQTPARDGVALVPTGTAAIAGVVVGSDRQPLRRVTVTVAGEQRYRRATVTDDAGRFSFPSLPAGRFTVTASKAGYPPMSLGARRPHRPGAGVLLADGQQLTDVTLTLTRGAVLAGTVYDHEGAPMPGVPIMAWEVRTSLSGERVLDYPASGGEWVTSDDRGRFRVFSLPPGEYTIGTAWHYHGSATGDVRVPSDAEMQAAWLAVKQPPSPTPRVAPSKSPDPALRYDYAAVFHPNTVDPMNAVTVALEPGEERDGIDLHMVFRPLSRIEGIVSTADGQRESFGLVLSRSTRVRAMATGTHTSTRPDGSFSFGSIAPGDYTLLAFSRATADRPATWALADITVTSADPVTLTLTLQPAMIISGRVRFETSTRKPPDSKQINVTLWPARGTTATSNSIATSIGASGEITIAGVTPGTYLVRGSVSGTPGTPVWRLARVFVDGEEMTDLPIDIVPGSAPVVEVVFTDQSTELTGVLSVPAGTPASDYFVVAIPADRRYWEAPSRRQSTRPDASGRYVFRGLPHGEYRVAVTTDLVPNDLSDPAALQQLLTQSVAVSLAPGEKKTFDVKIGR